MIRRADLSWLLLCTGVLAACERNDGLADGGAARDDNASTAARRLPEDSHRAPAAIPRERVTDYEPPSPTAAVRRVKAQGQLGPGRGTLLLDLQPPKHGKLTEGAPVRVTARGRDLVFPESIKTQLDSRALPLRLPIIVSDGATEAAEVDLTYYWCSVGDAGSCYPVRVQLLVELDFSGASAGGEAHLVHRPDA